MHIQTMDDDTFADDSRMRPAASRGAIWTGRGLSTLAALFMALVGR